MNLVALMWPRGRTSALTLAGAMGSSESALMVLKAFLRPWSSILEQSLVSRLVCCACRQLLDYWGEGVWARPVFWRMCCYFLSNGGQDRRTKDYTGLESAGLVVGPVVHAAVLVMATREPVANNEVVIWRYQSM